MNWSYSKTKKEWDALIYSALQEQIPNTPFEKARIQIHYIFPDRRRRDPDNYSGKMILDPLVSHGVIKDDSFQCIDLNLSAEVIPHERKTLIEVTKR